MCPVSPSACWYSIETSATLYLRVLKADEALKKQLENQHDEKYWAAITNAKPVTAWQQALPATNDLQQHSTEIKIDALPSGDYILTASDDIRF